MSHGGHSEADDLMMPRAGRRVVLDGAALPQVRPLNGPAVTLPQHLYIHVPLCRSKCAYCDFCSVPDDGTLDPADLVAATVFAAVGWLRYGLPATPLETLYIGGGTPSMLGPYLRLLVSELTSVFPLAPGAEVTVEANPDSLDARLLRDLLDVGVTRVSLGVQSLDDATLAWLGRPHDADQAIEAMLLVAASGLDLAVDLMCGVPHLPMARWRAMPAALAECGATHVSVYPLSVEEGTPLAERVDAGDEALPGEDVVADQMVAAAEELTALGFARYETANYARSGHESRHNTAYWTGRPYLGVGAGAHGMLTGAQARAVGLVDDASAGCARVRCAYGRDRLLLGPSALPEVVEVLDATEAACEDAMLGLRRSVGIDDALANEAGVVSALEQLEIDGLVTRGAGTWRTTERGWLLGNEVFGRVLDGGATAV